MSIDAIRKTESIWKLIFQTASDCIFVKDTDGRYVEVNKATADLFGMHSDQLAGATDEELFGKQATVAIRAVDQRVLAGETIQEEAIKPVHGEPRVFDVVKFPLYGDHGEVIGLCGIARDITAEREATRTLRKATFGLENAVEGILFLRLSGEVCFLNQAAAESLGYEKSALLGMQVHHFTVNASPHWWTTQVSRMTEQGTLQFESTHRRKDETVYPCEVRCRLICFEDEQLVYATFVDITQRRRTEKQLGELAKLLAHYNRLSSLGELASAIAHELNQPLAAITNNSFALAAMIQDREPDSEAAALAADISEQSVVAGEIVHRMRGFVSNHDTIRETRSIDACLTDTLKLLAPHIRHAGIDVQISPDSNFDVQVEVDPIQIQQVLVNLVCNAIEAMNSTDASRKELHIWSAKSASRVSIFLRDTGGGAEVSPEKMFLPFESTKADGMGMGLPISRSIVERHGGHLDVDCGPGGCTFEIALPISPNRATSSATTADVRPAS
ncbi:MAG: PAS domain-containing protein [Planctomycetaceae bacterium]|nr:PAS domain-containing protein [Planctomycetaceae bacterium]